MKTKINFLNIISKTTLFLFVAILVIFLSSYILSTKTKASGTSVYISGYIYSERIGWIDFQPHMGGDINMDSTTGDITGYAWSENIGWVKFGGLTGFPTGPGTTPSNAKKVGTNIVGWARVCSGMYDTSPDQTSPNNTCSGTSRTDGWDGWISLDGSGYGVHIDNTNNTLSGFAWGSDILGWIDFSPTISSSLSVIDFYAFPSTIYKGQDVKINWKTAGASTCTIDKNGSPWAPGSTNATSGTNVSSGILNTIGNTTFNIYCTGVTGTTIGPVSTVVLVMAKPPLINCNNSSICGPGDPIMWDPGDATGCTITKTSATGVVTVLPINASVVGQYVDPSMSVGDSYSYSCSSVGSSFNTSVTVSNIVNSGADCSVTQVVDATHPDGTIIYKDRTTMLGFAAGTPTGVTWTIDTNGVKTILHTNTNIFTTIGTRTIKGVGILSGSAVSCTKTINVKLDPGVGSGEQ